MPLYGYKIILVAFYTLFFFKNFPLDSVRDTIRLLKMSMDGFTYNKSICYPQLHAISAMPAKTHFHTNCSFIIPKNIHILASEVSILATPSHLN